MIEDLLNYFGKTITDIELRRYINDNNFSKVKKEKILSSSPEQSFWIEGEENGISLLFCTEINNKNYPSIPIKKKIFFNKKKYFIPRLEIINFESVRNKNTNYKFPFNLSFHLNFNEICEILGKPTYLSSDIAPAWLQDDGSESFYRWNKPLQEDIDVLIEYKNKNKSNDGYVREIRFQIKTDNVLSKLFNPLDGETIQSALKSDDSSLLKMSLFFLEWSIKNDYCEVTDENKKGIAKVQNGTLNIVEFVEEFMSVSYLTREQFAKIGDFPSKYIHRLSGTNIQFMADFDCVFSNKNSSYEANLKDINEIQLIGENYVKIEAVLNQRLQEFKDHSFLKSEDIC